MSIVTQSKLRCDICAVDVVVFSGNASTNRATWKARGWAFIDGQDLCPECSNKMKQRIESAQAFLKHSTEDRREASEIPEDEDDGAEGMVIVYGAFTQRR